MPAEQMDLQGYANFLTACAKDPRFTYSTLMAAIRKVNPEIGWFDRLIYKLFIIRATSEGFSTARKRMPGSTVARRSVRAASTPSIRTR